MTEETWTEFDDKVPRDRWGRPMIVPPTGGKAKPYTRVTTFAGAIEDYYGLSKWQQRMVAVGLSKRPDLLLSVAAHENDKDELDALTEAAKEAAAASATATIGTAVHKLAQRYDWGQLKLADVPESHRADLQAYAAAVDPFIFQGIEEFVVIDELQVGGTFDRIVEYDGQRYVADIKTGSIDYPGKMAIQLALYSGGQLYEPGRTERVDTGVSRTAGIIIHLPAGQGRCDLYWINLKAGWEDVDLCGRVRESRKRKGLLAAATFGPVMLAPPEPAEPTAHDYYPSMVDSTPQPKIGDQVTVGGTTFTKIGDDPFGKPTASVKHAGADGACPDYGSTLDPCPPGCASGTCVAQRRTEHHEPTAHDYYPSTVDSTPVLKEAVATVTDAFPGTTVLSIIDQINAATNGDQLEAVWSENRDVWTAEYTYAAANRKTHLHQKVLKDAVNTTT